jgi:signal recognition particle subunit SRP54
MFDGLASRLEKVFSKLRGYGKITKSDIEETLREIRIVFLEADVNFKVVKDFIDSIREKALGEKVLDSLTPGQQVIKIVKDEMIRILGEDSADLIHEKKDPSVLMLVGLQGSGKTTTAAKLGIRLKEKKMNPILCSTDVYRPAAKLQLKSIAERSGVDVFESGKKEPVAIAKEALKFAKEEKYDYLILDTAGRLHIDEQMMKEASEIYGEVSPSDLFYVADAMTGQDAVNTALAFKKVVPLTGIVLTKLDGDARGGSAFSIKSVTGVPIRFVGMGEKPADLELFHPDRLVSRILGMGDVLTLIEKAEKSIDTDEAEKLAGKMLRDEFSLEDFRAQLKQISKMGPIAQMASLLPGVSKNPALKNMNMDEKALKRIEAILNSMTPKERQNHQLLNGSRKKRIAKGSGTSVEQINQLLKQFVQMKKMMKNLRKFGFKGKSGIMDFSNLA